MDEDQAKSLWEFLQRISWQGQIGKQELWKDIEKIIVDKRTGTAHVSTNNNIMAAILLLKGRRTMYTKILLLGALLATNLVTAMEQTKEFTLETEASQSDVVRILLTDSQNSDTIHKVTIPLRYAKLIGAISGLLENPDLRETGFPLPNVTPCPMVIH